MRLLSHDDHRHAARVSPTGRTAPPFRRAARRTPLWGLLLLAAWLLPAGAALAQPRELFTPVPANQLTDATPAQTQRIDQLRQRRTTQSLNLVRIDPEALRGGDARLTLPDARTLTLSSRRQGEGGGADFTWSAGSPGVPGQATFVVRNGDVTGTINDGASLYRIEPVGGGVHALIKIDESRFPPEHPPSFQQRQQRGDIPAPAPAQQDTQRADAPAVIDVLVAYTPSAAAAVSDIVATVQLAVAEANQSYQNSGINLRLNLVDSFQHAYTEGTNSFDTILADFAGNAGVNARRNNVGADVAVLIINKTDYCGLADAIMANANTAFAIVHYDCATGYYSFAHEIGHLQGARHDEANDSTATPYAYGHGFQHRSPSPAWRTIMAYACPGGCTRLQYWSNPNVSYGGTPMGTAATNDNARVLNGTAATVAAFRNRPPASTAGFVWRYTGTACSGNSCPGWQLLDNNAATVRLAASAGNLYQLHNSGRIWRHTGTPCSGNSCPGWQMLDNNGATVGIVADGGQLYQLHDSGRIWRHTGAPCSGNSCPGWQMLDNNGATVALAAGGGQLYQLHNTGRIWRFTGTACNGNSCPGWQMLDNNGATVGIVADGAQLYQLHDSGRIWRFTGAACSGNSCPGWQMLDNNGATVGIVAAGGSLYQLHNTGRIWRFTGAACNGNACPGWQMLDNNPATINLVASGNQLYQVHNTGRIWRHTGVACSGNSCPGWQMLDNNGSTGRIAAGDQLYQLHLARAPMTRARTCQECRPH
ncbi:hypothetical protein EAH89_05315 [Roseomonas nepalensis]|uniref:Uncharacterized protein n=1 Tax=Muricoccus nepalensis TaxID=1854500 RepID=A0A502GDR8_9PROT|nr:M12 family metallo-peptidase [Roseomonas nepalensis]TPG59658.1 hypothetical protein EAH89_05315 [Roseomonas nepalensis]